MSVLTERANLPARHSGHKVLVRGTSWLEARTNEYWKISVRREGVKFEKGYRETKKKKYIWLLLPVA